MGVTAAWGEIEVYAAGFRAEYASGIALAHEPSRSTGPPARLREAARRYGVRLVPLADLEAEASEFALPLPDVVLPKIRVGPSLARIGTLAVRPASDLTVAGRGARALAGGRGGGRRRRGKRTSSVASVFRR